MHSEPGQASKNKPNLHENIFKSGLLSSCIHLVAKVAGLLGTIFKNWVLVSRSGQGSSPQNQSILN